MGREAASTTSLNIICYVFDLPEFRTSSCLLETYLISMQDLINLEKCVRFERGRVIVRERHASVRIGYVNSLLEPRNLINSVRHALRLISGVMQMQASESDASRVDRDGVNRVRHENSTLLPWCDKLNVFFYLK